MKKINHFGLEIISPKEPNLEYNFGILKFYKIIFLLLHEIWAPGSYFQMLEFMIQFSNFPWNNYLKPWERHGHNKGSWHVDLPDKIAQGPLQEQIDDELWVSAFSEAIL